MNCKKGDLAYIRVPESWHCKTLDGKFVNVGVSGECDLGTVGDAQAWMCEFHVPCFDSVRTHRMIRQCWILDSWLRPVRGDVSINEETHDEVTA